MSAATPPRAEEDGLPHPARAKGFNLSAWAITHQPLTRFFLVVLLLAGLFSYFRLGQNEDPEFTFRAMAIRTLWPGASAHEVEQQVTDRLEKKLQETPHLDFTRSYSRPGESVVFVMLRQDTRGRDVADVWYQVRKKIGDIRAGLPADVIGPFFNDEFGDTFGSIYALSGEAFSYAELKEYAEAVRQRLLRVPDVAKVELYGVQDEKIYVELSRAKLAGLGLDLQQVATLIQAQNAMLPAGTVITASETVSLRVAGEADSVATLAALPLRANGVSFRLGDVATLSRGYQDPPITLMRHQGRPVIGLGVAMRKGGDIIELGENLGRAVAEMTPNLPLGLDIAQVSDQPRAVGSAVGEFVRTLAEAVIIVLIVSFLSLGWRSGLVVALSIPLVLAITFLGMRWWGIDLQKISLGALIIALGLLVDDAMIAVEMMARKLEEGLDRVAAATFAYEHTAFPMLTGTLITVAGFLPIGTARSMAGEYVFSLFAVVGLSLLVSWWVAVYFVPYLGYKLLRVAPHAAGAAPDPYDKPFYRRFHALVETSLRLRWLVLAATLGLFAAAVAAFALVPKQFFPDSNRTELVVDLWLPEGASPVLVDGEARRLEALLAKAEDVVHTTTFVGQGVPRFYLPLDQQLTVQNLAQFIVQTRDPAARERVRAWLRQTLEAQFPGVRARVELLPNGPPVGYPVQFRVVGPDAAVLKRVADTVGEVMRANPHTRNVNTDWLGSVPVVRVALDQDKVRALGLDAQQVRRSLQAMATGGTIARIRDRDLLIDVVLRGPAGERNVLADLDNLVLQTPAGRAVPLAQIARLEPAFEEGVIWRRNRETAITVRADIVVGVQAPEVTRAINPLLDPIRDTLPPGYRIDVGGAAEESKVAEHSIQAGFPLAVFLMLTLLMFQLRTLSHTLMVVLTAPLGLIGAVAALLAFRAPFGFVAQLGVIALAGMIMRNSVILVDQIEQDIEDGVHPWHAIIGATVRRFRPIMLTAAAAVLAMIPLTRSIFWGPMAMAIMGGLVVATLLTLGFVPALYAIWFRVRPPQEGGGNAASEGGRATLSGWKTRLFTAGRGG